MLVSRSPRMFEDAMSLVGPAGKNMLYGDVTEADHAGRRQVKRSLGMEDELLLTLMKLRHNFQESDLAQRLN